MLDLLAIVCTAAALAQGGCLERLHGGSRPAPLPDAYELRVGAGAWHLSYSGSGHDFDPASLAEHWRRRAAQRCGGDYRGTPLVQAQHPEPGYDAMVSALRLPGSRGFNVEAYGVAHCSGATR